MDYPKRGRPFDYGQYHLVVDRGLATPTMKPYGPWRWGCLAACALIWSAICTGVAVFVWFAFSPVLGVAGGFSGLVPLIVIVWWIVSEPGRPAPWVIDLDERFVRVLVPSPVDVAFSDVRSLQCKKERVDDGDSLIQVNTLYLHCTQNGNVVAYVLGDHTWRPDAIELGRCAAEIIRVPFELEED